MHSFRTAALKVLIYGISFFSISLFSTLIAGEVSDEANMSNTESVLQQSLLFKKNETLILDGCSLVVKSFSVNSCILSDQTRFKEDYITLTDVEFVSLAPSSNSSSIIFHLYDKPNESYVKYNKCSGTSSIVNDVSFISLIISNDSAEETRESISDYIDLNCK